jgi:hypothetical protein
MTILYIRDKKMRLKAPFCHYSKTIYRRKFTFLWFGIVNCLFETTAVEEFVLVVVNSSNKAKCTVRLRQLIRVMLQYTKI